MTSNTLQDFIEKLVTKSEELKALKKSIKEIENDLPMELEDLLLTLKDLKKQVKDRKDEHLKQLLEDNVDYVEGREMVQALKEEIAEAKLGLFTEAANLAREHGDLDQTVMVEGMPQRLQTQKDVQVYVNGKVVK